MKLKSFIQETQERNRYNLQNKNLRSTGEIQDGGGIK